jgi:hypothetical protein
VNNLIRSLLQMLEQEFLRKSEHRAVHRAPKAYLDYEARWDQSRWDDPGDLGAAWNESDYEDCLWDQVEEVSVDLVMG